VLSGFVAAAHPPPAESIRQLDSHTAVREDTPWVLALESSIETEQFLLRVRTAAVQWELGELQHSQDEAPPSLFIGRFKSIPDVSGFVLDRVERISAFVLRERAQAGADMRSAERAMYRFALANAHWAFSMIGTDPDVLSFFAVGSRAGSEKIRASCRVLAVLLGTPFRREPAGK
jgi:hypothetical protein